MTSNQDTYDQARQAWLIQSTQPFAVHASHMLRKRPGTATSFTQLSHLFAHIVDLVGNRQTERRHPTDASGRQQYGDGFALVDHAGVGLFVRVRETAEGDGPSYSYFHATSIGLDGLVLSADLALLHDITLEPLRTPDVLTVDIKTNLLQDELEAVHATLARACARQGYVSDSHPHV